ncbi:B-cell antigen receptor complex-associated protein beta chain isoform X1 [Pyxicephalus adspersus]|uniref:B-cell antigen receptor complex-associated protein beta chain isoform X1 n=1 Tax=Pyxicephalus adspersus TaxID=30357 RepID=UPI003B5BEDE3
MMNTPEAVLSVVFIAIFIIEHGDSIAGTGNPGRPTTVQHKEPSKSPYGKFIHHQYEDTMQAVLPDPRFVGVRKGRNITIQCGCRSFLPVSNNITWFKEHTNGSFVTYVLKDEHISMAEDVLFIKNVQKKHNGVYICNFTTNGQKLFPCGTEVMVLGSVNHATAKSKNIMKDAIIMVQTILIVVFISVPVLIVMEMKKKRTLKIEDHTYEGLEAYQSATYEDIQTVRVLATKTMEGEHPCLE